MTAFEVHLPDADRGPLRRPLRPADVAGPHGRARTTDCGAPWR